MSLSLTYQIKKRWHEDICSDPVIHGFVLNLYLHGEQYPHLADDYFPLVHVDEPELAEIMRDHMEDEDKHALLLKKVLTRMEQPIIALPVSDAFNHVIRTHTSSSFKITEKDTIDGKRLKVAHFCAHLHFLEKRVATSLQYHLDACGTRGVHDAEKIVSHILQDELRHQVYTLQTVYDLLPKGQAIAVLDAHKRAERLADLDFSSQQVKQLINRYRERFPASHRWLYRLASQVQNGIIKYAQ